MPLALKGLFRAGFVLFLCLGCDPGPEPPPAPAQIRVDLVEEMATADVRGPRSRLRMADPAARTHLVSGFSFLEEDAGGPFLWAVGELSEIEIFLDRPQAFELVVHGHPFQPEGAPLQRVELSVNGEETGAAAELDPTADRFALPVPASATVAGRNVLGLRFLDPRRPVDWIDDARDGRPLAVQIYSIELEGVEDLPPPKRRRADDGEHVLEMFAGTRVDWFVEARPGDVLSLKASEGSADDLELFVTVSDAAGRIVEGAFPGDRGVALALDPLFSEAGDDSGAKTVRVELRARLRDRPFWSFGSRNSREPPRTILSGGLGSSNGPETPDAGTVVASGAPTDSRARRPPDMLIYMVDTLRADRLGAYGSELGLTPNFDRFAEDAVVFRHFRAQTSWTRTAVVSLLTGLYPQSHGVNDRDDGLPASAETLAEILGERGYRSVGVITNGNVGKRFGTDQGFEVYQHLRESRHRQDMHILSDQVDGWIARWLTTVDPSPDRSPFFLYAHVTDPHAPYTPHEPFRSRFAPDARFELGLLDTVRAIDRGEFAAGPREAEELMALYNAEVAFTDHHFGILVERLKSLGLYDSMAILVVSDHGEEFLEHGDWEHGRTLYEEQLRVPFLLKLPGNAGAGKVLDVRAGHVDVMPTLLDLAGARLPTVDGRSLLPAIRGEDAVGGAPYLAYLALEGLEMRSLVTDHRKLIDNSNSVDLLFDLEADPGERSDLGPRQNFEKGRMAQRLRRLEWELASGRLTADQVEIDPELRKQLEALGYIQ